MSTNPFETRVGSWLRELPDTFVYHPPDLRYGSQWRPGDYIVGWGSNWYVLECKEVKAKDGERFALSGWTAQQRGFCRLTRAAGGRYLLLVRLAALDIQVACSQLTGDEKRGSIGKDDGLVFDKASIRRILEIWSAPLPAKR